MQALQVLKGHKLDPCFQITVTQRSSELRQYVLGRDLELGSTHSGKSPSYVLAVRSAQEKDGRLWPIFNKISVAQILENIFCQTSFVQ